MKITKKSLKKIVREAVSEAEYGEDYLSTTSPGRSGEEDDPQLDFASEDDDVAEGLGEAQTRISKRELTRIIREERLSLMEECPSAESMMPCPIKTAAEMRTAGATEADVLHWVQLLISEFSGGTEEVYPEAEFSFSGDVALLPSEEAFGVGYEDGTRGLE